MYKNIMVVVTLAAGLVLCVFGYNAFTALGVIMGIALLSFGLYLVWLWFASHNNYVILATILVVAGIALIILCLFVPFVTYFLGSIVIIGLGIFTFPLCRINVRVVLPCNIFLIIYGVIMVFTPAFIPFLSVLLGVILVIYSFVLLIFLHY